MQLTRPRRLCVLPTPKLSVLLPDMVRGVAIRDRVRSALASVGHSDAGGSGLPPAHSPRQCDVHVVLAKVRGKLCVFFGNCADHSTTYVVYLTSIDDQT